MPIIKAKATIPQRPPKPTLVIAKDTYANITVDTKYQPKETLLAHLEGSSWTVNYYSQIVGLDSGSAGQGMGTDAVYQQYHLINSMEIKVSAALSSDQVGETGEMQLTGAANVYPFIIPNKGDMFVADLLDGRRGIFEVSDVRRLAVFREAVHSIDYLLVDFGTPERLNDLKIKTVKESFFEKDFIYHGQNPVLVGDDYENLTFLRRNYGTLITQYFKRYYSKEYGTLILPDQVTPVYDIFLVRALTQHLNTLDTHELTTIRKLNADDDQVMQADSIWTVIATRNKVLIADAFHQVGVVSANSFTTDPIQSGIRYSGVDKVIYPIDPFLRVDNQLTQAEKLPGDFVPIRSAVKHRKPLASVPNPNYDAETKIGIKDTFEDGYYVFSKAFYEDDRTEGAQSELELCVQDYLDEKEISYERIRKLVEASSKWDNVNSFYYFPVLIILIKAVIRAI